MQHLTKGNSHRYICGNGARLGSLSKTSKTNSTVNFAKVSPGFMLHEINEQTMTVEIIDSTGSVIHTFTQTRNIKGLNIGKPVPKLPNYQTVNGAKEPFLFLQG
jgi:hypothetical protein